jgi:hypothetical protein
MHIFIVWIKTISKRNKKLFRRERNRIRMVSLTSLKPGKSRLGDLFKIPLTMTTMITW